MVKANMAVHIIHADRPRITQSWWYDRFCIRSHEYLCAYIVAPQRSYL